jgi:HTH-type transcriptional regulator/antitoxin HigA
MVLVAAKKESWSPDWATHPGEHLAEYLESRGWSQAEFARLADMSPKHVSTIISGTNPITAETALKLERVLGLKASVWTGLQANWDLYEAKAANQQALANTDQVLSRFPVKELKSRGALPATNDTGRLLNCLLDFFGVGSPHAFDARLANLAVHHRQSKAFETNHYHVAAWLLLGEQKARDMNLRAFDGAKFAHAIQEIRKLTTAGPEIFFPRMLELCGNAGVAFVLEKPISKTCLFGSARWMSGDRAIIQMSLRMKSNDHFWWTFFHEAAHISLHKGQAFADDKGGEGDGLEDEADAWAEETLIGRDRFTAFKRTNPRSELAVKAFAKQVDIHPGIVVGMLQHSGVIPYRNLNGLKTQFEWAD